MVPKAEGRHRRNFRVGLVRNSSRTVCWRILNEYSVSSLPSICNKTSHSHEVCNDFWTSPFSSSECLPLVVSAHCSMIWWFSPVGLSDPDFRGFGWKIALQSQICFIEQCGLHTHTRSRMTGHVMLPYAEMNQAQNKYTPNSGKHVSCVFTRETSFIPCLDSGLFPRVKNYLSDLALVKSAIAFRCLTKVDYPINQTSRFSDLTKDVLPFDCSRITK